MKNWTNLVLLSLVVIWIGSACAAQTPQPVSPVVSPLDSPIPVESEPQVVAVSFQVERPLQAGATTVSGSGPPGVPILLQDVTFMGTLVGRGIIDENGQFEVDLSAPLEAGHRIGLTVDVGGTAWELEDFSSEEFYGEKALSVPQVGFYYDTAVVQE